MISVVQNLFNDNRKIGVILVSLGMTLLVMGVVLLFDPVLLAMGNILFLGGIPFLFGFLRSLQLLNPFNGAGKWKGTVSFCLGVALVMMRYPIIGMLLELYGMVVLFGFYFPMLLSMLRQIPVVGPYVDKIPFLGQVASSVAKQSPKYPNV